AVHLIVEPTRQHADHSKVHAVQAYLLADQVLVSSEASLPQTILERQQARLAAPYFIVAEQPSQRGPRPQQRKETRSDLHDLNALRRVFITQIGAPRLVSRH